jgi:hypothetical protein
VYLSVIFSQRLENKLPCLAPGTGLSIYLTDRMGRKKLLLLSGFGMAAAMSLLVTTYLHN